MAVVAVLGVNEHFVERHGKQAGGDVCDPSH